MKKILALMALLLIASLFIWSVSCGDDDDDDDNDSGDDDDDGECPDPTIDFSVCDLGAGPFSLTIDNEFFPLAVGSEWVLEGEEDGETIRVEIEVLDEIKDISGVDTRVVRETEYEDGELVEISWNWFAQAPDGTVCYFGEDVDDYEDGDVVGHEGAWEAGVGGAVAGIQMLGDPQVGDSYYQEFLVGEAEDMAEVQSFGDEADTPAGTFTDTVTIFDYNPLEDCEPEEKVFASGIGNVVDDVVELTSYTIP